MPATTTAPPRTFLGQPMALAYLCFTEAWERFSYYGMTSILVLYMSQSLLMPGHVEGIVGFARFRAALESVFGPMSTLALASQIMGLYSGLVYFTPVLGGWIADRLTGRRAAVMAGAMLMSAGHLAMAFDASFLLALLLLVTGSGLLKGNISTQVGELYAGTDGEGRTRAFTLFSMGINIGAVAGPLTVGLLAQLHGWHAGFGLAGMLMLIGLATYVAGFRHLPADRPRTLPAQARVRMDRQQWRIVAALAAVAAITIFQTIAYAQNTNIGLIWIDRSTDLDLLGFHVPVAWFNAIDPLASVVGAPLLLALWRWQATRGRELDDLGKIATGAGLALAANLLLALACLSRGPVTLAVPLIYNAVLGVAFLYYWPPLLALISRAAPAPVKGTLMGAVFLTLFVGYTVVGWLGGFFEHMTAAQFWAMHAAIAAIGGLLAFGLRRPLLRALHIA